MKGIIQLKYLEEKNYECECDNDNSYCKCDCFDMFLNKLYNDTLKEFLDQYIYVSLEEKCKLIFLFNIETGWEKQFDYGISSIIRTDNWLKERGYI